METAVLIAVLTTCLLENVHCTGVNENFIAGVKFEVF